VDILRCDSVDNFNDLDGFAALIKACDLVISADNSTVHFAGALGKPVWLLLPVSADWRWMQHRDDSPWYPNASLYRQTSKGDWDGVFSNIENSLRDFSEVH
jgi:ADP-heptose:LPS heptosyltransferase